MRRVSCKHWKTHPEAIQLIHYNEDMEILTTTDNFEEYAFLDILTINTIPAPRI